MGKELMALILPRLAQRLNRHLRRYQAGEMSDSQFSRHFEGLLQQQYAWLANQGIPELDAALAVHAAVLVLSEPGLKAEAEEEGLPLEVIEYRALLTAASDIADTYEVEERKVAKRLSRLVAAYLE